MGKYSAMAVAAAVMLGVGGAVLATVGPSAGDVREIRLVARDMSYVATGGDSNPTLRFTRGEKIRLVLTNDDSGYSHNLIAPVLGISTPLITHGRSQTVEVTVPDVAGIFPYRCGPHAEMMRGNIQIE